MPSRAYLLCHKKLETLAPAGNLKLTSSVSVVEEESPLGGVEIQIETVFLWADTAAQVRDKIVAQMVAQALAQASAVVANTSCYIPQYIKGV
jgi:hypothetical protein